MVIILSLNFFVIFIRSGRCATSPSSPITSQIIPAGYKPAIFARSTAASVWPALVRIPPL